MVKNDLKWPQMILKYLKSQNEKWDIFRDFKTLWFPLSTIFELFFIFEDSKVQYKAAYINLVSASDVASREYTQPWAKWMCQLAKKAK